MKNFKTADYFISDVLSVEEGMSDTFADLVAQSYGERHGNIKLNGQDVDLKKATILKYSGYRDYNNLVRTMLYPTEQKGKDKEAVFNYYFDNKLRFYELVLGSEYVKNLPADFNKNPCAFGFGYEDIYKYAKEDFKVLNEDSIYLIKNEQLRSMIDSERTENSIVENNDNSQKLQITNIKQAIKKEKVGLIGIRKIQGIIANKVNDRSRQDIVAGQDIDVVDYYEKYGIEQEDDWKTIKKKLSRAMGVWLSRSSSVDANRSDSNQIFKRIEEEENEIMEVRRIFDPKNSKLLEDYNARLSESRKRKEKQGKENSDIGVNKYAEKRLTSISFSENMER